MHPSHHSTLLLSPSAPTSYFTASQSSSTATQTFPSVRSSSQHNHPHEQAHIQNAIGAIQAHMTAGLHRDSPPTYEDTQFKRPRSGPVPRIVSTIEEVKYPGLLLHPRNIVSYNSLFPHAHKFTSTLLADELNSKFHDFILHPWWPARSGTILDRHMRHYLGKVVGQHGESCRTLDADNA
jgi:hypothetical protein